jgi:hypothetical protein
MQHTALPHNQSTQPAAGIENQRIEQCWRVFVAPDARIATCGVYQPVNGDLQLRIVYEPDDIIRSARILHLDMARSMAAQWLNAARVSGRFER